MFGLGFSEIVILAVLGLILLGPEQLPDMARTLGRFINDLKRTTSDLTEEFKNQGFTETDSRKLLEDIRRDVGDNPLHTKKEETPADAQVHEDDKEPPLHPVVAESSSQETDEHGKKPESN